MAAKKTSSTTTTTPSTGRGDPNVPDTNIDFTTQGDGSQQDNAISEGFSQLYNQMYDKAWTELRQMPMKDRRSLLQKLYNKGFGSSTEVSPDGLDTSDIDRYRNLLMYQFTTTKTIDEVVRGIDKIFPDTRDTSGGATKKLTPKADVDRIFGDVMRVQLGRGPKPEELEKFRNSYYGMERADQAPSLQSAATEQIQAKNTGEARAQRFSGYMDVFEQMLRGA